MTSPLFLKNGVDELRVIQGVKGAPAARPNKRPRLDPESPSLDPVSDRSKTGANAVPSNPKKQDVHLEQFLEVMQPRSKKGPSWANDAVQPELITNPASTSSLKSTENLGTKDVEGDSEKGEGISDLDWMRQRMSKALELGDGSKEKIFEQPDDEVKDKNPVQVRRSFLNYLCNLKLRSHRLSTVSTTQRKTLSFRRPDFSSVTWHSRVQIPI